LLRNKDQQQENPLPSAATQWSIKLTTAWQDRETVSCAEGGSYRQINCHCKNLIIYWKLSCRLHVFLKILVLRHNFQGGKCPYPLPADAHVNVHGPLGCIKNVGRRKCLTVGEIEIETIEPVEFHNESAESESVFDKDVSIAARAALECDVNYGHRPYHLN